MKCVITIFALLHSTPASANLVSDGADYGMASWYRSGHITANGERFNRKGLTAASRTLPFGTRVLVSRPDGRNVVVRINDRGPYAKHRIIDLSEEAGRRLGLTHDGVAKVKIKILNEDVYARYHNVCSYRLSKSCRMHAFGRKRNRS